MTTRSVILVTAQFIWLLLLILTGQFIVLDDRALLAIQILAALLGLWAIAAVGRRQMQIQPDVHPEAQLVTSGPFAKIRHPMYTSLLVFTAAAVAADYSLLRIGIWLALIITMLLKLNYEERLLHQHFSDYADYKKRSWRIIPWVY